MKNVDDLINIIFGKIDGSQHDASECAKYAAVLQALVAARADARLDAPPKANDAATVKAFCKVADALVNAHEGLIDVPQA